MAILNLDEPDVEELRRARDVESLTKVLQFSTKWRARSDAAVALGKLGDRRATDALIAALRDRDETVRQMAAEALGNAAEALGHIGDARAVEPLMRLLDDVDGFVRGNAAEALGHIGDARAVSRLVAALAGDAIFEKVAEALARIGEPAVGPLIALLGNDDERMRWRAGETLARIGEPAVGPLAETLSDPNPHVRCGAAEALGKAGTVHDVTPLITRLGDPAVEVRLKAIDALSLIHISEPTRR